MYCHLLFLQLHEYGYIPPPLPGGECYSDAAVAPLPLPGGDEMSAQLAAQLAALQAILGQLKSAAADGIDSLQLQQQLAQLQAQVDTFSTYVASQASALDVQLQSGLLQLQDSLANASTAVSSFVDTQMQQIDLPGKLAYVVDVLRKQEQQLVVELPKQFAELQKLAATAAGMVQETALQVGLYTVVRWYFSTSDGGNYIVWVTSRAPSVPLICLRTPFKVPLSGGLNLHCCTKATDRCKCKQQSLACCSLSLMLFAALQAASVSHLPELMASLDKSMGMLHDVLEVR